MYTPLHVIEFEYHPLSILHCNTLFYRCCLPRLILCPRASEPELCGQCNALACLERSEQCPPLIARYFISGGGPSERDAVSCSPSPLSPAAAAVTTTRTVLCIHWAGKEEMGTALLGILGLHVRGFVRNQISKLCPSADCAVFSVAVYPETILNHYFM